MMMSFLSRIWNRIGFELDQMIWRHRARPMRRMQTPAATKTAVFCDLLSMVAVAKTEAILACALRRHGYRSVVLLAKPLPFLERVFSATGDCQFIYMDDFITDDMRTSARQEAEAAFAGFSSLRDFLDLEVDGFRLGRSVLSLVLRTVKKGSIDFLAPEMRQTLIETLTKAYIGMHAAQAVLDAVKPDLMVIRERGYTPAAEFFDACIERDMNVVAWAGSPMSDCFTFKRYNRSNRNTHHSSLDDTTWNWLSGIGWKPELDEYFISWWEEGYTNGAWYNQQNAQDGKLTKSRQQIVEQLGLDPSKKTAVIFCHILYDASFFFGRGVFSDYQRWLVESVRCAIDNPNLNWVVKVHPVNVWKSQIEGKPLEALEQQVLREEFGPLPDHIKFLDADTDINTISLFQEIDFGLTVRGTVGLELPCYGKPLITAGTGRYSGRGFTVDPGTPEEFRAILADLHNRPPMDQETTAAAIRHAFGVFLLRPQKITSFRYDFFAKTFGSALLPTNVYISPAAWTGNAVPADVDALATWAADGTATDFLTLASVPEWIGAHIGAEMNAGENPDKLFLAQ